MHQKNALSAPIRFLIKTAWCLVGAAELVDLFHKTLCTKQQYP